MGCGKRRTKAVKDEQVSRSEVGGGGQVSQVFVPLASRRHSGRGGKHDTTCIECQQMDISISAEAAQCVDGRQWMDSQVPAAGIDSLFHSFYLFYMTIRTHFPRRYN